MVNDEGGVRCAGDQDQSQCWSAYEVSHHLLRLDLLCQPVWPSVAGGHTTSVQEFVVGFDQGGIHWFVQVLAGTAVEALSLMIQERQVVLLLNLGMSTVSGFFFSML